MNPLDSALKRPPPSDPRMPPPSELPPVVGRNASGASDQGLNGVDVDGAGGGAARAVARIDEAVDRLIFVDGLRGSAHAMKLRSSNVVMRGLDPRIHRFREEDGPAGHKRVHARLPTRYARGWRCVTNSFSNSTRVVRYSGRSLR